jgi:tetratricopeptide (TPR) repeat protein
LNLPTENRLPDRVVDRAVTDKITGEFFMTHRFVRKRASSLALAFALLSGTAIVATSVIPAEASAQRKRDRDRDRNKEESAGGGYTDAFREAYVPLDEALKADGADVNALRPQMDALVPLLTTNDEKIAGGGLIFNAGIAAQDRALQLRGMEIMLSSGMVPAENVGRYNFIAYQLANEAQDYAKARNYLQAAIDANFTTDTVDASGLRIAMAESYFTANELQQGLDYLEQAIADRKTAGQPVDEQWYRRGVTVAYENQITPEVYDFVTMWIADYPEPKNWRDAVNVARNLNTFEGPEMLDLFRLGRRVNALQDASDYDYYVDAADARRLPQEVKTVIEEGLAAGVVTRDNLFITEALETADSRIAMDRSDLPALERDAMAGNAELRTVVAAASAFLSYEEYAKAVTLYEKALGMPGIDTNEALTRLGIAQIGLGNYDAAQDTFGKVTGNRMPIARLWSAYATQLSGGGGTMGASEAPARSAEAAAAAVSAAPEMTGS